VTIDWDIIRWVGKDHSRAPRPLGLQTSRVGGIAAGHTMPAQAPQISGLAEWRPRGKFGYRIGRVVRRVGRIIERYDVQIDLAHFKASHLDAEVEIEQRQLFSAVPPAACRPSWRSRLAGYPRS